jgi:hypothetical protein
MTEKANLFYLTEPSKGVPVVLLQVGEKVLMAEVTLNQLALADCGRRCHGVSDEGAGGMTVLELPFPWPHEQSCS